MTPWKRIYVSICPWLSCSSNSWISAPSKPLTFERPFSCSSRRSKGSPSKLGASWSKTEGSGRVWPWAMGQWGNLTSYHLFFKGNSPAMLQCSLCHPSRIALKKFPAKDKNLKFPHSCDA